MIAKRLHLTILAALLATGCALGAPNAPAAPRGPFKAGEIVVEWREATQDDGVHARLNGRVLAGEDSDRQLVAVPAGEETAYCARYRAEPGVASAEPNFLRRSQHVPGSLRRGRRLAYTPSDPAYAALSPIPGQGMSWGLHAIHADTAWDVTAGSPEIKVAVIDTGCDMAHPDLAGALDRAGALNLREPGRPVDDDFGHGTHVAGIIAARGDNGLGTLGVAWRATVMPIRVLGVDGTGTLYDSLSALSHAVARGARVVNMSFGSPDRSEIEARAIEDAIAAGVVIVAAAGNEATTGNYLEYPASYPGVLSVAAVGPDLQRAPFSNYNSNVSLAAPGVDVLSTLPSRFGSEPYGYLSGTSMAAPMVAGAAALVFAAHPEWTGAQVTEELLATARDLSAPNDVPGFDVYFGHGLLDAGAAVGR